MIRSTNTMAYYNPSFYHTHWTDYDSYYDSAQTETPTAQSCNEPSFYNLFDYPSPRYFGEAYDSGIYHLGNASYGSDFSESKVIEYNPDDHGGYDFAITYSANAACSASTFSLPKVIEYYPDYCGDAYQKVSTQFVISYSVSEFNEPNFEEYDPTPYDGGYDIYQTYGKPLPPSNEICYPPSSSSAPKATSPNDGSSKGPIELKKGKGEEAAKGKIEEQTRASDGMKPTQIHENDDDRSSGQSDKATEAEYGRAVNQFPNGYGLEAMDLCEGLFGYWPCLSRIKKQTDCRQENSCGHWQGNQWQTAADYLFGSHYPYPDPDGSHYHYEGEPYYGGV